MLVLHTFGPFSGPSGDSAGDPASKLADLSPFVVKAHMLLKLAGREYRAQRADSRRAPKGKLPVLVDDGVAIADSTFIRLYIEKKYGFDFDAGLSAAQRGQAWAIEKMIEDHLYWLNVHDRWLDETNFANGPAQYFKRLPAPMRPLIIRIVKRKVRGALHAQGAGRYTAMERATLAQRGVDALSLCLGDKRYAMGDAPTSLDASFYAFVSGALCRAFSTPMRAAAESHANLVAYNERMTRAYFPELVAGA